MMRAGACPDFQPGRKHMSETKARTKLGLVGRPLLAGALAATGVAAVTPAHADIFMFIENIDGDVTSKGHEKWIELLSYTQTFRNTLPAAAGAGTGKVSCGDITVLKSIDKSSVKLVEGVVKGTNYAQVKIDFSQLGGKEQLFTYYKVVVSDVQLVAIEQTDQPDDARIVERVTLHGNKFDYEFVTQKFDGTKGDSITFSVDCRTVKF
jgi:type VI secretion system secreted protein Hcp